jgi:uncharacterized protein (TIGR03083 family)
MVTVTSTSTDKLSTSIPYVTADEAFSLMQTAFDRFIKLIETLEPEDWSKPTACTAWDVHDMVAHQAGGYASGTGYREMLRQYTSLPKPGQLPEDAINALQVAERKEKSPTELIAELKAVGSVAIHKWAYQFRLAKPIGMPHPVGGWMNLRYLMWVIHSRDTWMHHLDICRATGHTFEQTREHDGRIAALVMRDVKKALARKLDGKAITFDLSGVAGGSWKFGTGEVAAEIKMGVLEFNIFASGRASFEQARRQMTITGDTAFAEKLLRGLIILY